MLLSLLTASFVFSYFPVWKHLLLSWHHYEDYSHGFFIVPISMYILWQKREALKTIPAKSTPWGLVLMVFSLLMYYVGQIGEIATLSSISMVLVLFGVTLYLRGPRFFKVVAFPLCFLFFMIPVPSQIYSTLTIPLAVDRVQDQCRHFGVCRSPHFAGGKRGFPVRPNPGGRSGLQRSAVHDVASDAERCVRLFHSFFQPVESRSFYLQPTGGDHRQYLPGYSHGFRVSLFQL